MWGCDGKSEPAGDRFFAELDPELAASSACPTPRPADPERPPEASEAGELQTQPPSPPDPQPPPEEPERRVGKRASKLKAISLDMNPGYAASARQHAPQAIVYIDPYHVVQLANQALDEVRRAYWNQLRALGDQQAAKRFKDARRALLNKPKNLTDTQAATLDALKAAEGEVWRAYALKEAVREIFEHGLSLEDVTLLLDRLLSRPSRSRLEPFIRLGKTIRKHRDGILAAIRLGINNGRTEALNNKVRLITRRAYGFHSANAALALVLLTCGPITLQPPHELYSP